jgi:DNA-binding CsgD family transcriptional regulator
MAAFHHHNSKKRLYKKPKRDIAIREIRRLIIDEGLTNRQISEQLDIPQRTVERYISQLYKHDNELLTGLNRDEEMLRAHNICKDRMAHYRQEITENIARNKNASFKDQLAAWHLICELEAADLRLMDNAVEMVRRRSAVLSNNNHLVVKGSTAVNLKLKRNPSLSYDNYSDDNQAAKEKYKEVREEEEEERFR